MSAIAFLGPSLDYQTARSIWDIPCFPPIQRGQLIDIVQELRPKAVLIVDGYFLHCRAVLHREIMHAMRLGVVVYGAASMGALRACELRNQGMIGLGDIYQWYCDGIIDGDDDVAVIHEPNQPFKILSIPYVVVHFALQKAWSSRVISLETQMHLAKIAKSVFFADRTMDRILSMADKSGVDQNELVQFESYYQLNQSQCDIKRIDASSALESLRGAHNDG